MELTCNPTFTKTHMIESLILSLPSNLRDDLLNCWSSIPNSAIYRDYSLAMYKGLNSNSGRSVGQFNIYNFLYVGECPEEHYQHYKQDIRATIRIVEERLLGICEDIIKNAD